VLHLEQKVNVLRFECNLTASNAESGSKEHQC